jgi:hypothetical protein
MVRENLTLGIVYLWQTLAGCSRGYVSNVIHAVCKNAGVAVQGSMSRHTVSRAILEGGIAAKIQIGHELAQAEGKLLLV